MILFLAEARDLSLLQNAQTISEAHTVSYAMGFVNFSPGSKATGDNHSLPSGANFQVGGTMYMFRGINLVPLLPTVWDLLISVYYP
jgi:hypothetical protein